MNNSLIKRKKKVKLLWALTAIPLVVAGTVAASCGPVMNNSQGQSGDVNTEDPNTTPGGNEESEENTDQGTTNPGQPSKPDTKPDPEINKRKFAELKHEFEQKLVVDRNKASSINGGYITLENVGEYIDVLKGVNSKTGVLKYREATIYVSPITVNSSSSTIIDVNMTFTAYENSANISKSFGGFIEKAPYEYQELYKYVQKWNYWMYEDHRRILAQMYSTQIETEAEFRSLISLNIDKEYNIKFDQIRYPSTSSIEATLSIGLTGRNTIPRVPKVIRFDGFKQDKADPFAGLSSQFIFDDIFVYTRDLDWHNWTAKVINWDSAKSKNAMEKAILNAANKTVKKYMLESNVKRQLVEKYGLSGVKDADGSDTWKVEVQLPENWFDEVRQLTNWDGSFYDVNRSPIAGHFDGPNPHAKLKQSGWKPSFKLVVKSKKVQNLSLERTFKLTGTL